MLDRISFSESAIGVPQQRHVSNASQSLSKAMERLSSGLRINRAADDAAGSAIGTKLSTQVRGLAQANANAQDAVNLLQTADGGLTETASVLQRMRELVVQAANDTYNQADRTSIQAEIDRLKDELTSISQKTQYNGRNLLDGSIAFSRFTENNGAYIESNPTIGFPGNQSAFMTDVFVNNVGATEDLEFNVTIYDPHFTYVTLPGVAVTITTSAGLAWGEQGINEGFRTGTTDYSGRTEPVTGWDVAFHWSYEVYSPTLDAGKTFTLYMDHMLSAVTIDKGIEFQVGSNSGQTLRVGLRGVSANDLRLEGVTVRGADEADTHQKTDKALRYIDRALNRVNEERSRLGAWQNRLSQTVQFTDQAKVEQETSLSGIQDADYAQESATLTRNQVLQNASISLLAQANTIPDMALELLKTGTPASK